MLMTQFLNLEYFVVQKLIERPSSAILKVSMTFVQIILITMKMGIERILKENFLNLGEITSIQAITTTNMLDEEGILLPAIMSALDRVLPAIKAMGGKCEVISVDDKSGIIRLKYEGLAKLKQGLELVIKDVKGVNSVVIESF